MLDCTDATKTTCSTKPTWRPRALLACAIILTGLIAVLWPEHAIGAVQFVIWGLIVVAPIVIPGILLAAWIIASGADTHIAVAFEGKMLPSVVAASLIGAITPVCGVAVLPMMVGLLAAGVPLAPIMAFWLSSPITDPAMLATTAATLGLAFAIGKTIAAFGIGLFGGIVTAGFASQPWAQKPLRKRGLAQSLSQTFQNKTRVFAPFVWQDPDRRAAFWTQCLATSRLILICLIPAFAAEYALNATLVPGSLAQYVGKDQWWAIPTAVFVGAPAYIDGYAALPLTRGLIDNGMSPGAAMAFLISGGVVSIWGAMAIAPVLKLAPFVLYLLLAIVGSVAAGYGFGWMV